jgi:deazaflavin-dependent oxidoreductase (nitroreductase family)
MDSLRPPRTRLEVIRPFTTRVVNPVTRLVAGRLPGFAILHQLGRHSGRTYDTPMNVFHHGDAYLFALTYGSRVDWVRNVLAAGGCTMTTRGRHVRLVEPELIVDAHRRLVPQPVRAFLGVLRVTEFLRMRAVTASRPPPQAGS